MNFRGGRTIRVLVRRGLRLHATRNDEKSDSVSQAVEKKNKPSFRGVYFAEESLLIFTLAPGEIPRFARNDNMKKVSPQHIQRPAARKWISHKDCEAPAN